MQFQLSRYEYVKTIEFKTDAALLNVEKIRYFKEFELTGNFISKEFRYSWDNAIWSNWNTLTQGNLSSIAFRDNANFWLHVKYTRNGVGSGNIERWYIFYDSTIPTPPVPPGGSINADYLGGQPPSYYLDRENHFGPYTDLIVSNVADSSSAGVYLGRSDSSAGTELYFKGIKGVGGIVLTDNAGIITIDSSGISGDPGLDGGAWITNIRPTGVGNVGSKVYSSAGNVLNSCVSDTNLLTIDILVIPGHTNYEPSVTVYGNPAALTLQGSGPQWTGSIPITFDPLDSSITIVHENGAYWSTEILQDAPPVILSANLIGDYPGTQTELKEGDTYQINIVTDVPITKVYLNNYGAFIAASPIVSGNNVTITGTIADRGIITQSLGFSLYVQKSTGSISTTYISTAHGTTEKVDVIKVNNLYPDISIGSVTYPASQGAIKSAETALVSNTINSFNTVLYTNPLSQIIITNPTLYESSKTVTYNSGGYNISSNNFAITATRTANNATTGPVSSIVNIANTPATLSVSNPSPRLRSGGNDGTVAQNHTITITASQRLLAAPTLVKDTGGTWQGSAFSWSAAATTFTRSLQVSDNDIKADYNWGAISGTNLAGIITTSNSGTATYTLGGFVVRTITLPAFGWQANINVAVSDYTKLSSSGSGQVLSWAVLQNTRSSLGDIVRPKASTWSASSTGTNPTTISILDQSATDSQSQSTTFTIQESI